jgi:hypothetical protein
MKLKELGWIVIERGTITRIGTPEARWNASPFRTLNVTTFACRGRRLDEKAPQSISGAKSAPPRIHHLIRRRNQNRPGLAAEDQLAVRSGQQRVPDDRTV